MPAEWTEGVLIRRISVLRPASRGVNLALDNDFSPLSFKMDWEIFSHKTDSRSSSSGVWQCTSGWSSSQSVTFRSCLDLCRLLSTYFLWLKQYFRGVCFLNTCVTVDLTTVVSSGQALLIVAGLANLLTTQCICALHNSSPCRPPIIDVCGVEVHHSASSL